MKESIEQAIELESTKTLEKVWENKNSRNNHIRRVDGGHTEQHEL